MDKTTEYALQLLAALAYKKEYPVPAKRICDLDGKKIEELALKAFPPLKKGKKK